MSSDAYLQELPIYPNFALPNNKIDGLLPTAKVEHWKDLLEILQGEEFKKAKSDFVYRGQRGHNWSLASTLGRQFDGGEISTEKSKNLLLQFTLSMRGRGYELSPTLDANSIWAVGQHYGLYTPLLDWTRSPFVALFFAFSKYESEGECETNPSRTIFVLNRTKIEEDIRDRDAPSLFIEPVDHQNSRLVSQSGLFTYSPGSTDNITAYLIEKLDELELLGGAANLKKSLDEDSLVTELDDSYRAKSLSQYIFKLHIPNTASDRKDCLEALRQMNIHHGSLFPDPEGASRHCNDWLERLIEDERVEETTVSSVNEKGEIADIISKVTPESVVETVSQLLQTSLQLAVVDATAVAEEIKQSVDKQTSLDWHSVQSKTARVKLSITRYFNQSNLIFPPNINPTEVTDSILNAFVTAAKSGVVNE